MTRTTTIGFLLGGAALALAGCVNDRPGPLPGPPRACRAENAQRFVGVVFRPPVARRAQQAARARTLRVIRPGQAVTMDFRADRLNVEVDERSIVRAVRCG